jgi:hypothetical protein
MLYQPFCAAKSDLECPGRAEEYGALRVRTGRQRDSLKCSVRDESGRKDIMVYLEGFRQ